MDNRGAYTGNRYRPSRKVSMQPIRDITELSTGFPQQQPVVPTVMPTAPTPIDPAYEDWLRGIDSRGTYTPGLLEPVVVDDTDVRAIQMDRGMHLSPIKPEEVE